MKVLWITNILFPELRKILLGEGEQKGSGGWMLSSSVELLKTGEVELYVLTSSDIVSELTYTEGEKIHYVTIPTKANENKYAKYMRQVQIDISPNIVHIHGTELPLGYAYIKANGNYNTVISIQGVISEIAKYYYYGLSRLQIIRNLSLRDFFTRTIFQSKSLFIKRGYSEIEALKSVNHVIGRTTFDRAHALMINPNLTYHFCNETLRPEFSDYKWTYDKCAKHTLFLSQTRYPIKGAHVFFQALAKVKERYPDVKVFIAGQDITKGSGIVNHLKRDGYGNILKEIISNLKISDNIVFRGAMSATEMRDTLLISNVFVCPSSIENSSNSLGEAQLLGVPCIAAYVGGIPDLIDDPSMGVLYRFEDVQMLAYHIMQMFERSATFDNSIMRLKAAKRHNASINIKRTLEIYHTIQGCKDI